MRLATFLPPGQTKPRAGAVHDDEVVSFVVRSDTVLERLRTADFDQAIGDPYKLADVTLLAPVPRPRAIFGIGLNYAAHAAEQGSGAAGVPDRLHEAAELERTAVRRRQEPGGRQAPGLRGRARRRHGRRQRDRGLRRRRTTSARATCSAASRSGRARRAPTASARGARGSRRPTRSPIRGTCASRRTSTASCARTPRPPTSSSGRRSSSTSSRRRARSSPATSSSPAPRAGSACRWTRAGSCSPATWCGSRSSRSGSSSMPSPDLVKRLGELSDLRHAGHVLSWDQQVMMPPGGGRARAGARRAAELAHERLVAPELGALLDASNGDDPQLVRVVRRDHDIARRVPGELAAGDGARRLAGIRGMAASARCNDFAALRNPPCGATRVARRARLDGRRPMLPGVRALLDRYEPGTTTAQVRPCSAIRPRTASSPLLAADAAGPAPAAAANGIPVARAARASGSRPPRGGLRRAAWLLDDAIPRSPLPSAGRARDRAVRRGVEADDACRAACRGSMTPPPSTASTRRSRRAALGGVSLGVHEIARADCGRPRRPQRAVRVAHWLPRRAQAMRETLTGSLLEGLPSARSTSAPTFSRASRPTAPSALDASSRSRTAGRAAGRSSSERRAVAHARPPGRAWTGRDARDARRIETVPATITLRGVLQDIRLVGGGCSCSG